VKSMNDQIRKSGSETIRFGWLPVLGMMVLVMVVSALLTAWWIHTNIDASPFAPARLDAKERKALDSKLSLVMRGTSGEGPLNHGEPWDLDAPLEPEPYREDATRREISLSERELNALVAKDPEAARRVAIDLADDLLSVKMLVPLDENFPILGGKTLLLKFGVTLAYANGKPVVALRGVSLGGVPLPSAWWGDIKNKNLVEKFGTEGSFWDQFAKGVENINIREGQLWIKLKE
ncbi:MAG: hypothetical protein JXD19_07800, partial [Deltaproteobacteria bacterium]|nr:hypothetical protein [Deltaproteobacteria bacterium]